jgi:hypothetical protein
MTLRLDDRGNGAYAWKGGTLKTSQLTTRTGAATWHQIENDREGGFEVRLSEDKTQGVGPWWYTRIESNLEPTDKGGSFRLTRARDPAHTRGTSSLPDQQRSPKTY